MKRVPSETDRRPVVVAWAVVNAGAYTVVGYTDKAIQLALLAALVGLQRRV